MSNRRTPAHCLLFLFYWLVGCCLTGFNLGVAGKALWQGDYAAAAVTALCAVLTAWTALHARRLALKGDDQ